MCVAPETQQSYVRGDSMYIAHMHRMMGVDLPVCMLVQMCTVSPMFTTHAQAGANSERSSYKHAKKKNLALERLMRDQAQLNFLFVASGATPIPVS